MKRKKERAVNYGSIWHEMGLTMGVLATWGHKSIRLFNENIKIKYFTEPEILHHLVRVGVRVCVCVSVYVSHW